jgi:hypothetical protein
MLNPPTAESKGDDSWSVLIEEIDLDALSAFVEAIRESFHARIIAVIPTLTHENHADSYKS